MNRLPTILMVLISCTTLSRASDFLTDRYRFTQMNKQGGGELCFSVLQDKQGFLWMATSKGLTRFDGLRVKVYDHDPLDPHSLSNSMPQNLVEDNRGRIWVGTWGGGLNVFDSQTERFGSYMPDPNRPNSSLAGDKILSLFYDSSGIIWVGTRSGGLTRLNPETGEMKTWRHEVGNDASLPHNRVWALAETDPGRIWVGTENGLAMLDQENDHFLVLRHDADDPQSLCANKVQKLLADRNNQLWTGTVDGLCRFDFSEWEPGRPVRFSTTPLTETSGSNILGLFLDSRDVLWVSTSENAVVLLNPRTTEVKPLRLDTGDMGVDKNPDFVAGWEDRSNNLWLAGFSGLFWSDLKPRKFNTVPLAENAKTTENARISAILEDSSGILWVSVHLGGLYRVDRARGRVRNYLEGKTVHDVLEDRQGRIWLGTAGEGLQLLDPESGAVTGYLHQPEDASSLTSNQILDLFESVSGRIWVATEKGLNLFDPQSGVFVTSAVDPFLSKAVGRVRVSTVIQDRSGKIWAGAGKSLVRFDARSNEIKRFSADPMIENHLSNANIICLYRDRGNHLWVGTQAGLNRISVTDDRIRTYYKRDGLPDNTIMAILGDESDRLWISTNNGLSRYDPDTGSFINYDTYDGLPADSFREAVAFRSITGELFFGTNKGLTGFFPKRVRDNPHRPPVVLTGLKSYNQPIDLGRPLNHVDGFRVSHADRLITLEFAALDFTLPERNLYKYNLSSLGEEWVELNEPVLSLSKLDYGEQFLRIRAANSDGIWNEQGLTLTINRIPPIYKTWWAYTLYGCLIAALAIGVPYLRIVHLKKRETELGTLVSERTRELEDKNHLLGEKNRQLLAFDEIIQTINREFTMESLLQVLLEQGNKLFHHADVAGFMIFDYQKQRFRFSAVLGTDFQKLSPVTMLWNDAVDAYTRGHETLDDGIFFIKDMAAAPDARPLAPELGPMSMVVMSVILDGLIDGFLMFESHEGVDEFSNSDIDKLKRFRQHTISAIAKARNLKELADTAQHLKETQQQLMLSAHHEGMAEVATNVLHNVGNTLNSINTSAEIVQELTNSSALKLFDRIGALLHEHGADIMAYFNEDEKGMQIPAALSHIAPSLTSAHEDLRHEAKELLERVQLLRDNLADQEEYIVSDESHEAVELTPCLEAVLVSERVLLETHKVRVVKEIGELPGLELPKTRFLRVLEVLIINGIEAMIKNTGDRTLILRCYDKRGRVWVEVEDNGCGIDPNDQHMIFNQGFTTKKKSSSFGLHYCANVIKEMGGRIKCISPGPGLGARFILDLPIKRRATAKAG